MENVFFNARQYWWFTKLGLHETILILLQE